MQYCYDPLIATALLLHHSASQYYWYSLTYNKNILMHCMHCTLTDTIQCTVLIPLLDTFGYYWSFMVLPGGDDDKGSTGNVDSFFSGDPLASLFNAGRWVRWVGRPLGIISAKCRKVSVNLRWAWADPKIQRRLDWVHGADMGMERWADLIFQQFFKNNSWSCYIMLLVYHVEGSVCLLCVAAEWWRCICQLDRCDPVQPATFHRRS